MWIRRRVVLMPIAVLILGCAARRPKVGKIAVGEFEVGGTVSAVSRYHDPVDGLGLELAKQIVDQLHARERDAFVAAKDHVPAGDLIVIGKITKIDGGSRAGRLLMAQTLGFGFTDYGAGGGFLRAEGRVIGPDGKTVGIFSSEHKEKSTGWFWLRYGDSARHQVAGCIEDVAAEIAEMVDEGVYRGGVPEAATRGPSGAPTRTAAERLRELDSLHQQGMVSDSEYQEKRRRILEEL